MVRQDRPRVDPARRRVLVASVGSALWGSERSLLALAERLPGLGWDVTLVCPPGDLATAARAAGAQVVETRWREVGSVSSKAGGRKRYPVGAAARSLSATAANAATLARIARRSRADLVASNSLRAHPFVTLGARAARRPVVWHLRDIVEPGPGRKVLGGLARLTRGVAANSAAVAATVSRPVPRVIVNPIDIAPAEGLPDWANGTPVVGYLGRIDPRKGVEDLIDAAGRIDDARVVIVGAARTAPPGYVEGLQRRAETVAPGRVTFAGTVADPALALAGFDVLAVPSLREPWGRVAAEALTLGVPVVATSAGGLPEIVRDGVDGLLYPPEDVDALVARLRSLLDDPGRRREMARAGREGARRFDPGRHALEVAEFYEEAIGA